jgi:Flp pilus assembly protein TadG
VQRLRNERGAVSTVVALLMVPLLGFAAISIDVANLYLQKVQMHNVADAAALAVAQDCASGSCGNSSGTAQTLAAANLRPGRTAQTVVTLDASSGTVKVVASTTTSYVFAPVLGRRTGQVSATAKVTYGGPVAGRAVLPLAFSWCEWKYQTGGALPSGTTQRTIYLSKTAGATDCTGPSNNIVPGGFGWLTVNSGSCGTTTTIGNIIVSDPGNSVPNGCSTSSFSSLVGSTVLLPVFDQSWGSGSGATYQVYGYAAFRLTGYSFGGQYKSGNPCSGNERCVQGYFTRFVDLSETFTYGPGTPQLGVTVLKLTCPKPPAC